PTQVKTSRPEVKTRISHILLDIDFLDKPEVHLIRDEFGADGVLAVLYLFKILINEELAGLERGYLHRLYRGAGLEKETWIRLVELLIKVGWLASEDDFLYSPRLAEERSRYLKKREILISNGHKGGKEKARRSKRLANARQSSSISTDTDTVTDLDLDLN